MQALTLERRTAWINAIVESNEFQVQVQECALYTLFQANQQLCMTSIIQIGFLIRRWVMRSVIL